MGIQEIDNKEENYSFYSKLQFQDVSYLFIIFGTWHYLQTSHISNNIHVLYKVIHVTMETQYEGD